MDALLQKCLASPTVRSFVFKRQPEGKLPEEALQSSITYSYDGGRTAAYMQPPCVTETFVPHLCVDGFALGETLGLEHQHPVLPILRAASRGNNLSAEVSARRFVASLEAENIVDTLEFSWMMDGRLLICYRCTDIGKCWTWMQSFETRLYAPAEHHDEFPSKVELRMEICDPHPSMCSICQWKILPVCECARPLSLTRSQSDPSQRIVPRNWHNYNLLFHQLNRVGNVEVKYYESPENGPERLLHQGKIWYRIGIFPSFGDKQTRERQLQIYKMASKNLISSPQTDSWLQNYDDVVMSNSDTGGTQDESHGSDSSGLCTEYVSQEVPNGNRLLLSDSGSQEQEQVFDSNEVDDAGVSDEQQDEDYNPSPSSSNGLLSSDGDSFTCNQCGISFSEQKNCLRYVKLVPLVQNQYLFWSIIKLTDVIFECSTVFFIFLRHISATHGTDRSYTCVRCATLFSTLSELRRHEIKEHRKPAKPYCEMCGKKFRLHQSLELHVRTIHNQEKPFECSICKTRFARKSALTRHTKSVHMAQKYVCLQPGCHAQYAQPFDLKKHMIRKGHGGEDFSLSKRKATYTYNVVQGVLPVTRRSPSPEVS